MKMAATKVMIMAIIDGWPVEFFAFLLSWFLTNDFRSLHVLFSTIFLGLYWTLIRSLKHIGTAAWHHLQLG